MTSSGTSITTGEWEGFVEYLYRWLRPGGVLVFVLLGQRLFSCDRLLAAHLRDKRVYWLSAPDGAKYGQLVVFGVRRTRRERERLRDSELNRAGDLIDKMSRKWNELGSLPEEPNAVYPIPESETLKLVTTVCGSTRLKMCYRIHLPTAKPRVFCLPHPRRAGLINGSPTAEVVPFRGFHTDVPRPH